MSATAEALRVAYPKALSTLVRVTGSLDEAEDLLQEAAAKALVAWEDAGVADNPAAWLVRTARNYAIDGYRRKALDKRYAESTAASEPIARPERPETPGAAVQRRPRNGLRSSPQSPYARSGGQLPEVEKRGVAPGAHARGCRGVRGA